MTSPWERTPPRFLLALLGAVGLAAWSLPARADAVRVRDIRVSEASGDTAVVIATSARPTFTTWKLEQPARVVVELSGARLGNVDVPLDAGTYAVGLVSASVTEDDSAGPRTRVVLTLRQAADYRVESKGSEITLRVIPHVHPVAVSGPQSRAVEANAQALAKAEADARAQAQANAEAQARLAAQAKASTDAQARLAAQAKASAEAQARLAAQAKSEADARARAQADADAQARLAAQAKADADTQARLAAQAKADADAHAKAQAKAEARLQDEKQQREAALAKAEANARAEAAAKGDAERLRQELAAAKKEVERARADATAKNEAERARADATAKNEAERLRQELAVAKKEAASARADASAATLERDRQAAALARAEATARQAQAEVERAHQQVELAEAQAAQAKQREGDRDKAVRAVAQEVQSRQKVLDGIALSQEEQRNKLAAAERLVSERQASLRASEAELSAREQELHTARARHDSLARDASKQRKAEAEALMAEAERQRKEAAKVAAQSRQELATAVAARKQEEARKEAQAQARKLEEDKLARAIALRESEETRLADARAQRARMEAEQGKLAREQSKLEANRNALLAEIKHLKETATAAQSSAAAKSATPALAQQAPQPTVAAQVPAPTTKAQPRVATAAPTPPAPRAMATAEAPRPAVAAAAGPRSITLRPIARVRSIDFVDEPARSSVIVAVDDTANFTVEHLAGHRLSLRLEHSDLPDDLARNLDATEYLGPVKIITSYRDPAARATVRIDVDLAEEVPSHIRLDQGRIYWDFQKPQASTPSLPANLIRPPSVRFLRAPKVAGFVATIADASWLAQMQPLPFLTPPGGPAPGADTGAAPAPTAPSAGGGGQPAGGASGRYATLGKKRYTGRRIDLDFKGADIHNILRLLADVGQVNVVVADDVKGDVTIKMRDVPWDQALDVVLRSKGLGSVREGNLLRVAPLSLLEKELEAEIARQKQIAEVVPVETRLIGVSYADSGDLMEKARDLMSPRGKISHDKRTNTLIVSDVSKNLQLIEDLVRNLDTQTSQVTIEARIVEADSTFTRQLGVQWGGSGFADSAHGNPTGLVFPYNIGIGGGADDPAAPVTGLVPGPRTGTGTTGSPNFLVNMPAPAGLGTGAAIGMTLGSVAGAFNLNLRLSAMETTGQVRILSSPRVTTMDNVEARIAQGVSIPVSVVSAMGAQTQFVDAQLSLSVKPHVTNEGTISMLINITRNEPDFTNTGAQGDPTIQKKEAKTTMLVRDGDTAVIGGIYTRNTGVSYSRVPFFADIPVLGWFFRNKNENDNRQEFLVFITPRIANRARAISQ